MALSREDELWQLIKFDKTATPSQVRTWCRELINILKKTNQSVLVPNKSREDILKEMLGELNLIHQRTDIVETYIRLLMAKEIKGKREKNG